MSNKIFSWNDSSEWLNNAHLISWISRTEALASSKVLHRISAQLQEVGNSNNTDKTITLHYGLNKTCRKLSLLPAVKDNKICSNGAVAQLINELKDIIQPGESHYIAFDISDMDLSQAGIQQVITTLLITIYNQNYHLDELGYSSRTSSHEFDVKLIADPEFCEIAHQINCKAVAIAEGMLLARKLSDTPSDRCTPEAIAQQIESYCQDYANIDCKVLDMEAMQAMSMGALCAVGKGSVNPPRLVELNYRGGPSEQRPWALVGKGVTFDSGGLWIKSGAGMSSMKYDMCGAAVVFGVIETIRQLALPINVTAVLALAENMPTDRAMRPGDVVRTHSGLTVEIINTDAEGRLVLADAISYADKQLNPLGIINVATLTGAVVKTFGYDISGMMSNNDELQSILEEAAGQSYDRIWPLPLDESFAPQVKSNIADLCNTPPNDAAISISAGYFLSQFCSERPWAHLDVSGTALTRKPFLQASGRPIPLLTQFLCNQVLIQENEMGSAINTQAFGV